MRYGEAGRNDETAKDSGGGRTDSEINKEYKYFPTDRERDRRLLALPGQASARSSQRRNWLVNEVAEIG